MYYNMCVYVYMYICIYVYIYTTQIPKATKVLLPNLSTCIWGPRPTSFGHNVWSKPSSLGSTTVKVVLFYPLCHNIIVFFLPFFTTQPAFNFDLEAQLHCLSQPSQLAVQLRQRIARAGPIQSHGGFGDG